MPRSSARLQTPSPAPRTARPRGPGAAIRAAASIAVAASLLMPVGADAQDRPPLTFTDLMQIRQIESPTISRDGRWLAYTAEPDRGDPEAVVQEVDGQALFSVAPADRPVLSSDGRWMAARMVPSLQERETAERPADLRNRLAIVSLPGGQVETVEDVRAFAFSPDGRFLRWHLYPPRTDGDDEGASGGPEREDGQGTTMVVRTLATGQEVRIEDVDACAFAEEGARLACTVASPDDARDGVWVWDLGAGTEVAAHGRADARYGTPVWQQDGSALAFVVADPAEGGGPTYGSVTVWDGSNASVAVDAAEAPEGWLIPTGTSLDWSDDGNRLFFGWRPVNAEERRAMAEASDADEEGFDAYDVDDILADRGVDVWHWQDDRIMPQQKVVWNREKERTYRAVHHFDRGSTVGLGGVELPDVDVPDNASVALATSDTPYRWEFTWMGGQSDAYVADLATGERTRVAERIRNGATLSPGGGFVVWWHDGAWWLHDVAAGTTRNATEGLGVPMADEDHDYPDPTPGYGVAGWLADDAGVLLYDKYDLWVVPTRGGAARNVTDGRGRAEQRIFRLVDRDGDDGGLAPDAEVLLESYHDREKNFGFYRARLDRPGVTRLLESPHRYDFVADAEDADRVVFTREAYDEFPDLWVAAPDFSAPRKVTDVNPGLTDRFAWGQAELVEWHSADGTPTQGVVIKPGNYVEGRRYPVLVYYYRFFSQRLHEFNDPSVNHRPSFPVYASDGYVVFLPDVRFEVGRPGLAATKSVVPGVQKLVDMGLADPDRVALHGHSWSGYQTAFMVTQTDMFRTAIAGAPVSNMTSAYSGIRHGSGLARQFQYEMGQSRISGSLWEARDEYIDNSPVFFADRIRTPMLILHGDVDDAVPWEQSIEMYLAMRRLGKETVFLQYRDEPHHPQTYANKLDWAVKMKEWVDHYLKDAPAPAWITEGVPYTGR